VALRYLFYVPSRRSFLSALHPRLLSSSRRLNKAEVAHLYSDGPRHLLRSGKHIRYDGAMQTLTLLLGWLEGRDGWRMHCRRTPLWLHTWSYRNRNRPGYHIAPLTHVSEIADVHEEKASGHVHVLRRVYHYRCQLSPTLGSGPVRPEFKSYLYVSIGIELGSD
jgi:hypothetical protein